VTYKLFYAANSASMGVRVLMEELGVEYELLESTIDRTVPRSAEQIALNPNGWIPVLVWDKQSMYECAAITIFLCDSHPEAKLAPSHDDPKRALFLQTLVYFSSSVQTGFQLDYYPDRFTDSEDTEAASQRRGIRRLRETWKVIDEQIGNNKWLLGENFSAADIYLFMLTTWLRSSRGHPSVSEFPGVERIANAVAERPSTQIVYREWLNT